MHRLFNNILIPVNLHRQDAATIERAMQMALQFNCDVHLLHVTRKPWWPTAALNGKHIGDKVQLLQLRERYAPMLAKGCKLHAHVSQGNPETMIAEYASIHQVDLVLAEKPTRLDINKLASKTNCAILNLLPNPSFNGIKNIVLPVGGYLPLRRILMATYLSKKFNASVHLISLMRDDATQEWKNQVYLQKTFQLLTENTSHPVNCSTVIGENIAETTLEYAKKIEADLILANPGRESLFSWPLNRLFTKFLFNQSQIPVITVS